MKILLIRTPFEVEKHYFPRFIDEPLGIESLAAFISPYHETNVIDCISNGWNKYWELKDYPDKIFQGIKLSEIKKKIKKYKPNVIGISWLFSTQSNSVNMVIDSIKDIDANIKIIVGGSYPSTHPQKVLNDNKNIDIVVFGEGEITLKEVLDNLNNLDNIDGIAYKKNNKTIVNKPRELIRDLNILPIPFRDVKLYKNYSKQNVFKYIYSLFKKNNFNYKFSIISASFVTSLPLVCDIYYYFFNQHRENKMPIADISTSRGCPNNCTFCAVKNIWGRSWRFRTAKNVLEEIDILVKKYGIKHINIIDDNFNVSKDRIIKICKGIIERDYNITLSDTSGIYLPTLDEEVLIWLKRAGLNDIRISIESGSDRVLHNIIKKNIDLSKVKNIVDICKKLNIHTEGCFMFGVPGEKIEDMEETLSFAKRCGFERIVRFIFQPFPNTELHQVCIENNYLTDDYNESNLYVTGNKCYVKTEDFSPEDVLKFVNRKF